MRLLKADGIDAVFRQNAAGRITGATFVDHRTKTVLNGSRLGKSYSANVFQELFNNPRADRASLLPKLSAPAPAPATLRQQTPQKPEDALSLLLKINNGFRTEVFRRLGLIGNSEDWERLARGVIQEFEENNSGVDLFHFDSDEDVFCVYSQYIDDLMLLSKMIRAACDNEKTMRTYLGKGEVEHEK